MHKTIWFSLAIWAVVLLGCSQSTSPNQENTKREGETGQDAGQDAGTPIQPEAKPERVPMPTQKVFGGKRPVTLQLPPKYDPAVALPLVLVLHGAGVTGQLQAAYFGLDRLQQEQAFLLLAPNGTVDDKLGGSIWNATKACCDLTQSIPDAAYIKSLLDDVKSVYRVDEKRVYLIGHSNGAFLSYRMACDEASSITGIAALAGATFFDKARCKPSRKVNILHIHGTSDPVIRYKGGNVPRMGKPQPGAVKSVNMWKDYNGCSGQLTPSSETLDLISDLKGAETTVQKVNGCPKGGAVELWTIQGGAHIPTVAPTFAKTVWNWLQAKAKD